ncbi:MAG: hypothetical protein AAFQ94_21880 [Bacteroidota bacterium]
MKRIKSFIYAVILISLPFLVNAGSVCTVSSNSDLNTGHCRVNPNGGGDYCFSTGTGPGCSGSYVPVTNEPKIIG